MLRSLIHRAGRAYLNRIVSSAAESQRFVRVNERPVEYSYAMNWLNQLQPRTILDVGTGESAWPALLRTCGFVVTAIDNVKDYWTAGMVNRHWSVIDDDIRDSRLDAERFDAVTCISVIEHIEDHVAAMRGMRRLLRPGGHVILTTPFGLEGHPNVYTEPDSYGRGLNYRCRQSSPRELGQWKDCGFDVVDAQYWRAFDSQFWSCGALTRPIERSAAPAHLGTFVLRRLVG